MVVLEQGPDIILAGGAQPDRFDPKEAWYPIFYVQDLDPAKPQRFTLLGQDLVIWWEQTTQTWRVFVDQCPHRLVPLSEGRINEQGHLECPYHGWSFSGSGDCQTIPQADPETHPHQSLRACAQVLPTAIAQGLLFVYPGQSERAEKTALPLIPDIDDSPDDWVVLSTFRDLPYDAMTLLENVLDSSHVPYTHHQSMGNRATAGPVNLNVHTSDRQGFTGFWPEGPRQGTLGSQHTVFIAPNLMWHDLTAKQLGRTLTVVYATPIRKGECRAFARFPFKFASQLPKRILGLRPQWYNHMSQNGILEDDQVFLHWQERHLEERLTRLGPDQYAKAFNLATKSDRYVDALHKWQRDYYQSPFAGQTLTPAQPATALLERYHSHTAHCKSCSGALQRVQQLKAIAQIILLLSLASLPLLFGFQPGVPVWGHAIVAVLILIAGGSWWGLSALEKRFYKGRLIPPRNLS
jgi:phenylpropionate dioxygenase-like ring-hydroxylating dioxygenase large terminal subunit